jgi:anti-anti-sigma factor
VAVLVAAGPDNGVVVVTVNGELDLDSAPLLRAVFEDLLHRGAYRIVVDTGGLRFCDSIGLSALMTTHLACEAHGGFLRLARPTGPFLRLLGVVGVAHGITSYRTIEGASSGDATEIVEPATA